MKKFIGTKLINAKQMTRLDYNILRGWELPQDENGTDEGYLVVEYLDGGQTNHPDFSGYISWSPTTVFEKEYRPVSGMSFGLAVEALKRGERIARSGWNGKGMWVELFLTDGYFDEEYGFPLDPYLVLKTAGNTMQPGWNASTPDVLAEDWQIVVDD